MENRKPYSSKNNNHERESIGFIGLGIMGMPMARNLIKAGFEVTVYNRTKSKAEKLASEGTKMADSLRELAEKSSVIITIVTDTPDVEGLVLGENGLIDEAIRHYRRALEAAPEAAMAFRNLGDALARRGDLEEAIAFYRQAVVLEPDAPALRERLERALAAASEPQSPVSDDGSGSGRR